VKPWNAALDLQFSRQRDRTVVARRHVGPLRVQKALYPEGDSVCQVIVVHPPGGIAGGDALRVDVEARTGSHAQVTTPGATKWYKAQGRAASQQVELRVDGTLEWLPQEAIVFDQAEVRSSIDIRLATGASMLGWDIVALGRTASGERFSSGCFRQTIRLLDDCGLQWVERTRIDGGDALLESPIGLAGAPVFGCLWASGPAWSTSGIEALRERLGAGGAVVTQLAPRLVVARALGATTRAVRRALEAAWRELRPLVLDGRAAVPPRIWAT
jgi:urease accessory protein